MSPEQFDLRGERVTLRSRPLPDGGSGTSEVTPGPYEILLVDDHPLIRQGIRKILAQESGLTVLGEMPDGLELLDCLHKRLPHLIILDISLPQLGGIEATRRIKSSHPEIKVLILTLHNRREYVDQARLAGAEGYLLKDEMDKELLPAIETLRQGGTYLSPLLTEKSSSRPFIPGMMIW
jgi:DNA-binding NarL/FixJ family response regulator